MFNSNNQLSEIISCNSSFSTTREYDFFGKILASVSDKNVEFFTECVNNYDKITPLDKIQTHLLLTAKNKILEHSSLFQIII